MELTRKLLYSVNSASSSLDLSRSKIYSMMKEGSLRFVVVGGDRRIPAEEIERIASEGAPAKAAQS